MLVFLNMGAAPSSGGQILHRAKTINLMKLLWNITAKIITMRAPLELKTIVQNGTIKVVLYLHKSQSPPSS